MRHVGAQRSRDGALVRMSLDSASRNKEAVHQGQGSRLKRDNPRTDLRFLSCAAASGGKALRDKPRFRFLLN